MWFLLQLTGALIQEGLTQKGGKSTQIKPVRQISLSITNLEEESSMQLSLFEERKWQKRKLGETMDQIRRKYGTKAILRAVSYTEAGTAIHRSSLLGGHKK